MPAGILLLESVNEPESTFAFRLPREPDDIDLDPDQWILSEETSDRER